MDELAPGRATRHATSRGGRHPSRDAGQAVLLVVVVVAVCGLLAVGTGRAAEVLIARQQAQSAADASALAALGGGGGVAAAALAESNGATLVSFERITEGPGWSTVRVTVRVRGVEATATATDGP
jgi:hypothetical protein